jgi:hypothetical protein
MNDNRIDTRQPGNQDMTERLQQLRVIVKTMPVADIESIDIKNTIKVEIERQLVVGAFFDAMESVCSRLDAIAQGYISIGKDTLPHDVSAAVSLADDIFADCRIPYRVVPGSGCVPVTGDDPDDNPPPDDNPCENHIQPGWQPDGTLLVPPHRTVDAGKFCPTCGGWYPPDDSDDNGSAPVTGDDPDDNPPPDDVLERFEHWARRIFQDNPPHEITECDDCGCDDWLNEDDLCQSCAPLVSDRDVSPCECGSLCGCVCFADSNL